MSTTITRAFFPLSLFLSLTVLRGSRISSHGDALDFIINSHLGISVNRHELFSQYRKGEMKKKNTTNVANNRTHFHMGSRAMKWLQWSNVNLFRDIGSPQLNTLTTRPQPTDVSLSTRLDARNAVEAYEARLRVCQHSGGPSTGRNRGSNWFEVTAFGPTWADQWAGISTPCEGEAVSHHAGSGTLPPYPLSFRREEESLSSPRNEEKAPEGTSELGK